MEYLWIVFTMLSSFFFAMKDITAKKTLIRNSNPNQLIFEQNILLLIIILFLFLPRVEFYTFKIYWYLYFLKAISVASANIIYFELLKKYEISLISPLLNLSPVFLLFFSVFLLSERISLLQGFGIILIVISTYFLNNSNKENTDKFNFLSLKHLNWKFLLVSFSMLIFFSLAAIFDKMIFKNNVNVFTNLYFTAIIIFVVLLVYYFKEKSLKITIKNLIHEPQILLVSVFYIISKFFILMAISIPSALVSLIIPLRRTSTFFSSLIGGMLFHEKNLPLKLFAVFGMLIGVFLIVF